MIFADAMRAFGQVLSPEFRRVLMKSLALTIAILALVWLALTRLFEWWLDGMATVGEHPWVATLCGPFRGARPRDRAGLPRSARLDAGCELLS